MSSLVHCIYVSTASAPLAPEELLALLQVARRNNARDGITGILLAAEGTYFQVLEGEAGAVAALFDKIAGDARHARVTRIIQEPVPRRDFGEWTMGYAGLSAADLQSVAGSNDFFLEGDCFARLDAGRTKKLLEAFRQGRWRGRLAGGAARSGA